MVIDLAKKFPEVEFIMLGSSRDKKYGQELIDRIGEAPNITLPGFVNQFEDGKMEQLFGSSWILVNTAACEGLPNFCIEGAAHRCAILSSVDPDAFPSRFGKYVVDDDFEGGLRYLLENDRWKELGEAGFQFVYDTFRTERSIDEHIALYKKLLEDGNF